MGRPPGQADATLDLRRRVHALAADEVPTAVIAEHVRISPRYVARLLAVPVTGETSAAAVPVEAYDPPPRPLRRSTVLERAFSHTKLDEVRGLDDATKIIWLDLVLMVHRLGDGFVVRFGRYGDRIKNRRELAYAFSRTEQDLQSSLATLYERGLLLELEEGAIGIPPGLGLTPKVKARRLPVTGSEKPAQAPAQAARGRAPDPRQPSMPLPIRGGLGTETPPDFGTETPPRVGPETPDTGGFDGTETPESAKVWRTETPLQRSHAGSEGTTTTTKAIESLDNGSGSGSLDFVPPAHDRGTETPIGTETPRPNGTETPPSIGTETPVGTKTPLPPVWAELAVYANERTGRPLPPTPADLAAVAIWMDIDGASPALARQGIDAVISRGAHHDVVTLRYFTRRIQHEVRLAAGPLPTSAGRPPATAAPATPARQVMDDLAIEQRVAQSEAWASEVPGILDQWTGIRAKLRAEAGEAEHRAWLRHMALEAVADGEVTINLPDKFHRDMVQRRFGDRLQTLWCEANPEIEHVECSVATPSRAADDG
jgi:hypothetical protein